jgi:hypothetical protein
MVVSMAEYRLDLQTRTGGYIEGLAFRDLQGEFFLNKPCQMRWSAPLSSLKGLSYNELFSGIHEVKLFRNDVAIYAGPIWSMTATSKEDNMKFESKDISSYLHRRIISADARYKKKTFGYIAWDLINDNQAMAGGDLGITLGTQVPSTAPKGSPRYAKKSATVIWKAIDKLSSASNGFDWYIDANRQFHALWPRPQGPANVALEYRSGIKSYALQVMGEYEANYTMIRGGKKHVSNVYTNVTARNKYGLRQYAEYKGNLKTKSKLNAYAKKALQLKLESRFAPTLTVDPLLCNPFDGDILLGQIAHTVIDDGWVQYNGDTRMTGFQLTVGKQGDESFNLYVSDMREVIGDDSE